MRDLEIASHGILISGAALEISVEAHMHFENLADMVHGQGLSFIDGKSLGCTDCVFNLAAIELVPGQNVEVLLCERHRVCLL